MFLFVRNVEYKGVSYQLTKNHCGNQFFCCTFTGDFFRTFDAIVRAFSTFHKHRTKVDHTFWKCRGNAEPWRNLEIGKTRERVTGSGTQYFRLKVTDFPHRQMKKPCFSARKEGQFSVTRDAAARPGRGLFRFVTFWLHFPADVDHSHPRRPRRLVNVREGPSKNDVSKGVRKSWRPNIGGWGLKR